MTSYLRSTRDFLYNRRRPFIVAGGIVGGVYMVANYAISKLTEVQTRMVEERRDRENLKRRFAQNQEDCSFTILALLPTLGDQLFSHMDVEGLTAKLQRGRQSPTGHDSRTPAINGEVPASVDVSTFSIDQNNIQQNTSSNDAMEEIWNKLGPSKETKVEAGHGMNGTLAENDKEEQTKGEAVIQEQNGTQTEEASVLQNGDGASHKVNGSEDSLSPAITQKSAANNLEAVSEPAPKPIPSTARLSPSPVMTTPEREASGEGAKVDDSTETPIVTDKQEEQSGSRSTFTNGSQAEKEGEEESSNLPAPIKEPSPEEVLAEKRQKLALWNELKITAFSRTITTLYSLVLLSLQTHVQLNLLGRYAYLSSVVTLSAPASTTNHRIRLERHDGQDLEMEEEDISLREEDELRGIDVQTERLYLTFSWWFLHQGWKELADDVKAAVEDVFGGMALKTQLTHQDFILLLNKVRRRVEYETKDEAADTADARSEWSEATATTTARKRGKRKTFLSILFPPTSQEIWVLEKAGAIANDPSIKNSSDLSPTLPTLLDETKDLVESRDFARILRLCLGKVFDVFEGTLRPTFGVEPAMTTSEVDGLLHQSSVAAAQALGGGNQSRFQQLTDDEQAGIRVRLASLFPAVARQSSAAINGVPNEYVEALTDIKELKAFSAVIYSSWS